MRTYKATYYDKRGTEETIIQSDGSDLFLSLRGVELYGHDFEMLTDEVVDHNKFDYELYADGSGDITNFKIEVHIPILLFDRSENKTFTETLHCYIEVGETVDIDDLDNVINGLKLTTSFGEFVVNKKIKWFEYSLIALQELLPEHIYLKTCISCKYGNYNPYGNGMFGNIYCFKNFKEELKQIRDKHDMLAIWTEEAVKNDKLFSVQETFDCTDHQIPTKHDWFYKNWNKLID